jgi:hypothetical protein
MVKKAILCGAVAVLLAGTAPVLSAKAQSFVLDPNNNAPRQYSRDAKPAYGGGVIVPYNPDSSRSSYQRSQTRTRQQQQQTGPISYGAPRDNKGGAGSIYNGYSNSEEEKAARKRTPDHEARLLAYRERQKAHKIEREQKIRERAAAQEEAMARAKEEYDARNGGEE